MLRIFVVYSLLKSFIHSDCRIAWSLEIAVLILDFCDYFTQIKIIRKSQINEPKKKFIYSTLNALYVPIGTEVRSFCVVIITVFFFSVLDELSLACVFYVSLSALDLFVCVAKFKLLRIVFGSDGL